MDNAINALMLVAFCLGLFAMQPRNTWM